MKWIALVSILIGLVTWRILLEAAGPWAVWYQPWRADIVLPAVIVGLAAFLLLAALSQLIASTARWLGGKEDV